MWFPWQIAQPQGNHRVIVGLKYMEMILSFSFELFLSNALRTITWYNALSSFDENLSSFFDVDVKILTTCLLRFFFNTWYFSFEILVYFVQMSSHNVLCL